jgi:MSHA biogenesis protein MshQ
MFSDNPLCNRTHGKFIIVLLLTLLFSLLSVNSFADRVINSVTLNSGTSVTVNAGDTISVSINVTTSGSGSDRRWRCTDYTLNGSTTDEDHGNHDSSGTYTETFNITAPASSGTYDFDVIAYRDDSCSQSASSTFSLASAITVSGGDPDADCSSEIGDGTINEVVQDNGGNTPFIEVKVLNSSFSVLGWKLELCADTGGGGSQECETISAINSLYNPNLNSSVTWLVFEGGSGFGLDFDPDKIDFQNGFSITLQDSSNEIIDVLTVNGYTPPAFACTGFLYDTDVTGTNNGTKFVSRTPDGTGDWDLQQSSNVDPTPGETNDGPSSTVGHYAVYPTTPAITCEPGSIVIEPHDSGHTAIPADGTTITLSTVGANNGWVKLSGNGSLVGDEYTFAGGEISVTLGVLKTTPATLDIDVTDGTYTDIDGDVGEDADIVFDEVGLRFYADSNANGNADGTGNDLPNQVAGVVYHQGILRAIATDNTTGECVSALTSAATIPVNMAYECNNPNSCIRDKDLEVAGVGVEENDAGVISDYQSVNLAFDLQGEAPFSINYFDAGRVTLHATMTIPANGDSPAVPVIGESNSFVVRPHDLLITQVQSNDATPRSNPETTSTGLGFVAAGEDFTVRVQAQNFVDGITPNFGKESTSELAELNFDSLIFPSGVDGTLANGNFALTATDGEQQAVDINWSEVGTFTAYASLASGDYLSSGAGDVAGATSGNIGRFYPYQFTLTADSVIDSCAATYSYLDDPSITVGYTVTAVRAGVGGAVLNYDTALLFPVADFTPVAENANDGASITSPRITLASSTWVNGVYTLNDSAVAVARTTILEEPMDSLVFGLEVNDALDSREFDSLDMNPATSNDCTLLPDCDARQLSGTLNLRFGRLFTQDVHGPESSTLPMPFQTQYWSGGAFIINTDDTCTAIPIADIEFNNTLITTALGGLDVAVGSSITTGSFFNIGLLEVSPQAGDMGLFFTAPGAGNTGSFPVDVDLSSLPWLQYDWDQDGLHDNSVPTATVTFGSYRGHDRVIYWREKLTD